MKNKPWRLKTQLLRQEYELKNGDDSVYLHNKKVIESLAYHDYYEGNSYHTLVLSFSEIKKMLKGKKYQ